MDPSEPSLALTTNAHATRPAQHGGEGVPFGRHGEQGQPDTRGPQDRHEERGRVRHRPARERRAGPHQGLGAEQQDRQQPVVDSVHGGQAMAATERPDSGRGWIPVAYQGWRSAGAAVIRQRHAKQTRRREFPYRSDSTQ
ncbi:hypothetical protein [Streptomyces sp. DSM 40484]|uniref:hypothetical protein n=1 Tax=Streptomyces kroppenstedtii TaxID=3051181 RepID=UPI0028D1B6CB|nr:hypothetical protein [Streptomyces sp. DSM 40484]